MLHTFLDSIIICLFLFRHSGPFIGATKFLRGSSCIAGGLPESLAVAITVQVYLLSTHEVFLSERRPAVVFTFHEKAAHTEPRTEQLYLAHVVPGGPKRSSPPGLSMTAELFLSPSSGKRVGILS